MVGKVEVLNLGTRMKEMISFTSLSLYPHGNRRSWVDSTAGLGVTEKRIISCPCRECNSDPSVAVPTELSRLPASMVLIMPTVCYIMYGIKYERMSVLFAPGKDHQHEKYHELGGRKGKQNFCAKNAEKRCFMEDRDGPKKEILKSI
jgi:hypothetical protein